MKEFLIILAINFIISLIAFYVNYRSCKSGYLLRTALFDFLICSVPFLNIVFLIYTVKDYIFQNINEKFEKFLNTKIK